MRQDARASGAMQGTINRPEDQNDPLVPGEYFVVGTRVDTFYVSKEMAQAIEARLDESPVPRWITFVDLTGARIRVLARVIDSVSQCTAEQRAFTRAFFRARRHEDKADRDWDVDD